MEVQYYLYDILRLVLCSVYSGCKGSTCVLLWFPEKQIMGCRFLPSLHPFPLLFSSFSSFIFSFPPFFLPSFPPSLFTFFLFSIPDSFLLFSHHLSPLPSFSRLFPSSLHPAEGFSSLPPPSPSSPLLLLFILPSAQTLPPLPPPSSSASFYGGASHLQRSLPPSLSLSRSPSLRKMMRSV